MFRKYCQGQKLQATLKILGQCPGVHNGIVRLIEKFRGVFCSGKSGLISPEARSTGFDGKEMRSASSKLTLAEILALLAPTLVKKGLASRTSQMRESSLTFYSSFIRYGQTYSTASETFRNSHIVTGEGVPDDWAAAQIEHIVGYSSSLLSPTMDSVFLIVRNFEDLSNSDARNDPYRQFPYVGGRVYYDTLSTKSSVVPLDSLMCHFARTSNVLPDVIRRSHIHALPLDKVRCIPSRAASHC